jgi:hypothetical protein
MKSSFFLYLQEHFQRQGAERAMVSTVATAKQVVSIDKSMLVGWSNDIFA